MSTENTHIHPKALLKACSWPESSFGTVGSCRRTTGLGVSQEAHGFMKDKRERYEEVVGKLLYIWYEYVACHTTLAHSVD
jgi:hypothetical protein